MSTVFPNREKVVIGFFFFLTIFLDVLNHVQT